MRYLASGFAALGLLVGGASVCAQLVTGPIGPDGFPLYAVDCSLDPDEIDGSPCVVDRYTYVGWRVFHRTCNVCHAQDALGSDFAPNLVNRVRQMDSDAFLAAMENGYTGDVEMRPWGRDPNVRPYYLELWAYLSARANGDLLPGEPQRVTE